MAHEIQHATGKNYGNLNMTISVVGWHSNLSTCWHPPLPMGTRPKYVMPAMHRTCLQHKNCLTPGPSHPSTNIMSILWRQWK